MIVAKSTCVIRRLGGFGNGMEAANVLLTAISIATHPG